MKLTTLLKETPNLYRARSAIHLRGRPGVGKSDTVECMPGILAQATGHEFGMVTCHLTTIDAPDVRGFLVPSKTDDGRATSLYTEPFIIAEVRRTGKEHGVLFLDERGQADHLVQKAIAPLILQGRIGSYQLPPGWWIVSASNRTSDRAGVNKPLSHLINRECEIDIDPDLDAWCRWADDHHINPMFIGYARARVGEVFTNDPPKDDKQFISPRSLVAAHRYLTLDTEPGSLTFRMDTAAKEVVQGFLGEAGRADLFAYLEVASELVDIDEVLRNPLTARVPTRERMDACYAQMQVCVHHTNAKTIDTIFSYLRRLPLDLVTSAACQMMERTGDQGGGVLLNSKSLSEFVREHRALIVATIGNK